MSPRTQQVIDEALQLPAEERARLAAELLASLDPPTPDRSDAEWIAELERRARAATAGEPGVTWDEVRGRAEKKLADR